MAKGSSNLSKILSTWTSFVWHWKQLARVWQICSVPSNRLGITIIHRKYLFKLRSKQKWQLDQALFIYNIMPKLYLEYMKGIFIWTTVFKRLSVNYFQNKICCGPKYIIIGIITMTEPFCLIIALEIDNNLVFRGQWRVLCVSSLCVDSSNFCW